MEEIFHPTNLEEVKHKIRTLKEEAINVSHRDDIPWSNLVVAGRKTRNSSWKGRMSSQGYSWKRNWFSQCFTRIKT